MKKLKIMTIFGTRPEAIKMAPVIKRLKAEEMVEVIVTVTAQHREMLDQVLNLFDIKSNYDLNIMQSGQTLSDITVRVLKGLEEIIILERPDLVLVHGDTTSTFVGALGAFYHQIKVGHVEAGLRTYNKYSPFPEEMNRHLTGSLADLHLAPTSVAKDNLLSENIPVKQIFVTGNTVIDALLETVNQDYSFKIPEFREIDFANKKIILLTAHRRENLGQPMENIFTAVRELVELHREVEVVFPVHLNPRVRESVNKILAGVKEIRLIEPLDYQPFVNLMARSYLVLTDSGGIQEEAPALGKPVLVLRNTTERPEAVMAGTVKLVGTDRKCIISEAGKLLTDNRKYRKMAEAVNPYGDGQASRRILQRILFEFGLSKEPGHEFQA
jgi:UDP-N-acetylglucosamine 2-epimerase (non-hydrolysing)